MQSTIEQRRASLHAAASAGDLDVVKSWVVRGAAIDARDEHGRTPLLLAVLGARWAVATYLISRNADIFAVDAEGVQVLALLERSLQKHRR